MSDGPSHPLRTRPDYGDFDSDDQDGSTLPRGEGDDDDVDAEELKEALLRLGSANPSLRDRIRPVVRVIDDLTFLE